jgi:hypothetical protein
LYCGRPWPNERLLLYKLANRSPIVMENEKY